MKKETTRTIRLYVAAAIGFIACYFTAIYFFAFIPSFGHTKEMTEDQIQKRMVKMFGEEMYQRNKIDTQWFLSQNPSRLEIESDEGFTLAAFFLAAPDAKGTILMMHGFRSSPLRDFATLARFYNGLGYNVCMPYQRAHGESGGKFITFGIKERFDCRNWILKIDEMFEGNLPIFVTGISMGCATAVMTSGFTDLPMNLRGFIADCGFTVPREIIVFELMHQYHIPSGLAKLVSATAELYCKLLAGFSLDEYTTFDALRVNRRPFLFIHGTKDTRVPLSMTLANYETCSQPKELFLAEGAIHAISYLQQEEAYKKTVANFLNRYGAR